METTFLERLELEKNDLKVKLNSLNNFLKSNKFNELDFTNQSLLQLQGCAMQNYLECLELRLGYLSKTKSPN